MTGLMSSKSEIRELLLRLEHITPGKSVPNGFHAQLQMLTGRSCAALTKREVRTVLQRPPIQILVERTAMLVLSTPTISTLH